MFQFVSSQVGKIITHYGPDLLTSCGNPQNILSVGTTYVVGIGGPCSAYGEWTQYSQYPTEHLQALSAADGGSLDNCSGVGKFLPSNLVTLVATVMCTLYLYKY